MDADYISVLKLKDVLIVIFPPNPDDKVIAHIQKRVLERMQETEARGLLMDISTVEILDSYFARVIAETAEMVRIMGGRTIISGMRPSVAITAAELGIVLHTLETALDIDKAFDMMNNASIESATNASPLVGAARA